MRVHWHWTQRPGLLSLMRNSIDKPAGDFAVDPGVCIEARERAGLEWLLRFCARSSTSLALPARNAMPLLAVTPCAPTEPPHLILRRPHRAECSVTQCDAALTKEGESARPEPQCGAASTGRGA